MTVREMYQCDTCMAVERVDAQDWGHDGRRMLPMGWEKREGIMDENARFITTPHECPPCASKRHMVEAIHLLDKLLPQLQSVSQSVKPADRVHDTSAAVQSGEVRVLVMAWDPGVESWPDFVARIPPQGRVRIVGKDEEAQGWTPPPERREDPR